MSGFKTRAGFFSLTLLLLPFLLGGSSAFSVETFNAATPVGLIEARFQGQGQNEVILVKDRPQDVETQKKLTALIGGLAEKSGVKTVYVESGSGDVSLGPLTQKISLERRKNVAVSHLRSKVIQAPEAANLIAGPRLSLFGVEDRTLYGRAIDAYEKAFRDRALFRKDLARLEKAFKSLSERIYPARVLLLEKARTRYQRGRLSLGEYTQTLISLGQVEGTEPARFFKPLIAQEKKLNFAQIDEEAHQIFYGLSELEKKELLKIVPGFAKPKAIAFGRSAEEKSFFLKLISKARWIGEAPALESYVLYLQRPADEFEKLRQLEDKAFPALLPGSDAEKCFHFSRALSILRRFSEGAANEKDLERYRQEPEFFRTGEMAHFLERALEEAGLAGLRVPHVAEGFNRCAARLYRFYEISGARESAFVSNLTREMGRRGETSVVFVTHPWHLESIQQALRSKKISYRVVSVGSSDPSQGHGEFPFAPRPMRERAIEELVETRYPAYLKLADRLGALHPKAVSSLAQTLSSGALRRIERKSKKPFEAIFRAERSAARAANRWLVEKITATELEMDRKKYEAFKDFSEEKPSASDAFSEAERIEDRLRRYERSLEEIASLAETERQNALLGWERSLSGLVWMKAKPAERFFAASFSAVIAPVSLRFFEALPWVVSSVVPEYSPDFERFDRTRRFLSENLTRSGMPLSYKTQKGYWEHIRRVMNPVDSVLERLMVEHSVSIYDASVWQIALTLWGDSGDRPIVDAHTKRLLSGASGGLREIRAYGPMFRYGDQKRILTRDNAFFFRIIADQYVQTDPEGEQVVSDFPNFKQVHHEDWKAITGEQAWAAIIGPLQSAYLKYGGAIPADCPEMRLAKSVIPAIEAMVSRTGGIYHAPEGTYGKNSHDISNENNLSMLAALRMLETMLAASDPAEAAKINRIILGQEQYFRTYAFDREKQIFYQGGFSFKDRFIPTKIFAVDCQTWGISALTPEWIDRTFGDGTAYRIWNNTIERAGYLDEDGSLLGVGFTEGHRIVSVEWTCGAILACRLMTEHYQKIHPDWAEKTRRDALAMRFAMERFKMDVGRNSDAYLYSNERFFIPFGWWANPIPNLVSCAWILLTDMEFNPFVLGGGEHYKPLKKPGLIQKILKEGSSVFYHSPAV